MHETQTQKICRFLIHGVLLYLDFVLIGTIVHALRDRSFLADLLFVRDSLVKQWIRPGQEEELEVSNMFMISTIVVSVMTLLISILTVLSIMIYIKSDLGYLFGSGILIRIWDYNSDL